MVDEDDDAYVDDGRFVYANGLFSIRWPQLVGLICWQEIAIPCLTHSIMASTHAQKAQPRYSDHTTTRTAVLA